MEILPGVHRVPGVRGCNAYLIEDDAMALVDTGTAGNASRVWRYIEGLGRRPQELRYILITHSHPDHTGSALAISRLTGARIVAHVKDTRIDRNGAPFLSYVGFFTSLPVPLPLLQRTSVDHPVDDGFTLPLQGGLRVIHTPGHTPGSACYLLERSGVLFSGDMLLSNGLHLRRSWPFPGSNRDQFRQSLRRLAQLEFQTVCSGHGKPLLENASERLRELMERHPDLPTWREVIRGIPGRMYRTLRSDVQQK